MKLYSGTSTYHNENPNEDKVNSFYFSISDPEKSVSLDIRPLVCPFHKVKHLPPHCPTLMNTVLRLPLTRQCLIFRECRSQAIIPLGWVASCPSHVAARKILSLIVSASFLPPLLFEEGVSSPVLCYTSLSHFNTNMLWLLKKFYWSMIDIQCCVNFYCTAKWFSFTYIYIPFYILFHYGLSQDAEYSSLCYTVGPCCLRYAMTYISVLLLSSHIISPPLSHLLAHANTQ